MMGSLSEDSRSRRPLLGMIQCFSGIKPNLVVKNFSPKKQKTDALLASIILSFF